MKRSLLVASFLGALCTVLAFQPGAANAKAKGAPPATPTPSAAPSALPTPTPEPPDIAIPRLQEKLKSSPNDRPAMTELAMQYLGIGRPDLAIQLTQKLLQMGEKTAQVYFFDGSAQEGLGRVNEAIADLENASNLDPTNVGVLGSLTQLYLRVNRPSDAERIANRSVTFNKTDARSYINLGLVYATEQKWDDSRKQFEQAYSLDNKDVTPLIQEAQTFVSQKNYASALSTIDRALAADPKNVRAMMFKADTLSASNDVAKSASAYDDAVAAAGTDEDKISILVRKAVMYGQHNQRADAENVFNQAIKDYPKSSGVHVAFGEYYLTAHQNDKAEQQFRAALGVNKDDGQALMDLAQIKMSQRRFGDAVPYLKHLADVAPSAQVYGVLGQAYVALHRYNDSREACARSFSIQRSPDTLGCIAASDYSLKNYKEASQLFDILNRSIKQFMETNPQLLYMSAVSYEHTKQNGKAVDAYKRVLKYIPKKDPQYKKIQQSIASLSRPAPASKKKS